MACFPARRDGDPYLFIDARIPVRFDDPGCDPRPDGAGMALILPAGVAMPESSGWVAVRMLPQTTPPQANPALHPSGCACCGGRSEAALILIALFQARARGEVGFFRSVLAILPTDAAAALRRMLADDAFLSGCFVAIE